MLQYPHMEIVKEDGEKEEFSKNKFCTSLKQAGAENKVVTEVCDLVERELRPGMTTSDIFRTATRHLLKQNKAAAARYNCKEGIAQLGPAGFLFEKYLETLLRAEGYSTTHSSKMKGACVTHEIDVLGKKKGEHVLVEAKYRNQKGLKTHVDTVMYADARLVDIEKVRKQKEQKDTKHIMWVITNTKFTKTAIKYGTCRNMRLTGWDYPKKENLADLVKKHVLYPVTSLPSVNKPAREAFAKHNLMLAQDIAPHSANDLHKKFGIEDKKRAQRIINEAHALVYGK